MNNSYNGDYVINGRDFVDSIDENTISKFDIPKNIVFFYNDIKLVPNKVFDNWKELNPDYKLIFFDFKDSAYFFEKKLGLEYKTHFNKITYAPHKSDFFRLCFLYVYGGIYSDIDNVPLNSINDFYKPFNDVKFCTSLALDNNSFAQALICSTRNNLYLDKCIKEFVSRLETLKEMEQYKLNYSGAYLTGTVIMYNAIRNLLIERKETCDIIRAHTEYVVYEDIDNIRFANKMVLLDEYTPNSLWQNAYMRTGYDTVIKCRYEDYPWFGHDRNPDTGYETNY